jgi:hypothetical protein
MLQTVTHRVGKHASEIIFDFDVFVDLDRIRAKRLELRKRNFRGFLACHSTNIAALRAATALRRSRISAPNRKKFAPSARES